MLSKRLLPYAVAASLLVVVACGGEPVKYSLGQSIAVNGTPPPPPPPPPPKPVEPPKPPPRVELRDNKIEIREKIQFEVNKAIIKPESFGLMKEIGDVIKANPQVKKLSIEGHASAEGNAQYNKKLSDDRAKAVMDYLVKKENVPADHLTAKGWGSEKPIGDNTTEEGREKNRRVEFLVTEQDITQKKVEIDPTTGKERVVEEKKESVKAPDDTPPPPTPATTPSKKPASTPAKPKPEPKK
ncbi:MAG TPA: OmpA family protein [Labilithrix sp.]|jgi:OOP family OmpA-OmpF porin